MDNGCDTLGAAMRSCSPCKAAPLSRNWVRAHRADATEVGKGTRFQSDFSGVPNKDSKGRIAHVRAMYIAALAEVTLIPNNQAVTAYQLRGLFGSVDLGDTTGWKYFDALDLRTVLDDQYFRTGSNFNWPGLHYGIQGANVPDITADNGIPSVVSPTNPYTFNVGTYIPLVNPRSGNPVEGLIPLALLQDVGALAFVIQSQIPGAPNGVTFDRFVYNDGSGTTGLDVWLDIVYLDGTVIDAPWNLAEYTRTNLDFKLNAPERETEYAWLRYFPEDDFGVTIINGQELADQCDGITVTAAGFQVMGGFRNIDAQIRTAYFQASDLDGAYVDNNPARDLPLSQPTGEPLALCFIPWRPRGLGPAGAVELKFQSRTPNASRLVHRTVACHEPGRAAKIAAAMSLGTCRCVGTTPTGQTTSNIGNTTPIIVVK